MSTSNSLMVNFILLIFDICGTIIQERLIQQEELKMYEMFKGSMDILFYVVVAVVIIGALLKAKKKKDNNEDK